MHPTTLRPRETCDIDIRFNPTYRIAPFRLPLFAKCSHGLDLRLLQMSGTCHATEVRLSEHSVSFGDVIVGSQAQRSMRLHNFGDLGAKFRFEVPGIYSKVFSVAPSEGFVRPSEELALAVTFHPTADRLQEFRRAERQQAARRGKTALPDSRDVTISVRDIRCIVDGHSPLTFEASGHCVEHIGEASMLEFVTEVRDRKVQTVTIKNTTDSNWKLHPQVTTTEPAGMPFFHCPDVVLVPAGKEVNMDITYLPLLMTNEPSAAPDGDDEPQRPVTSPGMSKRLDKHRGTLFIGTPDGQAISYVLQGTALPPKVDSRIQVDIPCKKRFTQAVPMENWLHEKQRFKVKVELLDPSPGSQEAQGVSLQAVDLLDLPPGLKRDYKFNIYAYHEGTVLVRVVFTSEQTQEFKIVEVAFKVFAAQSLATIELKAACRQLARHKIAVANPLMKDATFRTKCSNPNMRFVPDQITVPPRSEKTLDLLFRPLEEAEAEDDVTLESDELGSYPYTVKWTATPAGLERALMLKAPLGGSTVETFKFMHYAKNNVTYTARVEPAPSHKGNPSDFVIETSTVSPPPASDSGSEVKLEIRYQPSGLGECRAKLVVSGAGGGEYQAMLTGYAQPPQPQGPISIAGAKPENIKFRNPFAVAMTFNFQVDNPAFTLGMRQQKIDPQKEVDVAVQFKSDGGKTQGGRLIISCAQSSTPWIFFLKGEV
eukprot:TRINITY_DN16808_c0_g5_i1.p1 TRINITY_DN16808_c0_g5~~TRINITY_DN16808_c0_g5_i1.p1  ORF type:complete len:709 (+),score=146.30 TRINITY_DN16808_c0_g5_i1:278-2404(+)